MTTRLDPLFEYVSLSLYIRVCVYATNGQVTGGTLAVACHMIDDCFLISVLFFFAWARSRQGMVGEVGGMLFPMAASGWILCFFFLVFFLFMLSFPLLHHAIPTLMSNEVLVLPWA